MPNRIIKESIHASEKINKLTDFQFRLWVSLITYVDDYGRGDARPAIIKGTCFPLRERITNKDIDAALKEMAGIGCIILYEVDGRSYLCFPNWESHQTVRNKKSKYPAPDPSVKQIESKCKQMQANVPVIQSNPNPNPNPITFSNEKVCTSDVDDCISSIVKAWNDLPEPIAKISGVKKKSQRAVMLNKRIQEHSFCSVLNAIKNIRNSDFLQGGNDRGWIITFDWFIKPNNFLKVLEGNYNQKKKSESHPASYDIEKAMREIETTVPTLKKKQR